MIKSEDFSNEDFLYFKEKIFEIAGIHLTDKKKELVRSRVQSFLRESKSSSVQELRSQIDQKNPDVIQLFINSLTTNKTDFFREPQHFKYLQEELIPKWKASGKTEVAIWCCASSTGEEPYTIAMSLDAHLPEGISWKVLATDIDTRVLQKARNGVYPNQKLGEIPDNYRKYLVFGENKAAGWFKLANTLHSKIQFKKHNLIEDTYPGDEVFDLIFCRNVLIYFERKTINKLMHKLHRSLKSDGSLFIGHSESIQGTNDIFHSVQPAIFTKVVA